MSSVIHITSDKKNEVYEEFLLAQLTREEALEPGFYGSFPSRYHAVRQERFVPLQGSGLLVPRQEIWVLDIDGGHA